MTAASETLSFEGYRPGAGGEILGLHMAYYAANWGLGRPFESWVAAGLAEFLGRYDDQRDLLVCVRDSDGSLLGSIVVDGFDAAGKGARLRWFIVAEGWQGAGLGRNLMQRAIDFSDRREYPKLYLTTFAGLDTARHLYEQFDFVLTAEVDEDEWQGGVREQWFERTHPAFEAEKVPRSRQGN